jgi:hypothetical protein
MEKGSYKSKKIDFKKYEISKFPLTLREKKFSYVWGCGSTALSLITNRDPSYFSKLNKYRNHYDDKFMTKCLKKEGYTVIPVTVASLTNAETTRYPLTSKHMLLVSQMLMKNEGTWSVIFGGEYICHNYQLDILTSLEFCNHPLLSVYCLFKKSLQ